MTGGFGVDVAVEAVGTPNTFDACTKIVRPGGSVANAGVHGSPVESALQDLWIMEVTITTGMVSTSTTPMLLTLVATNRLRRSPPTPSGPTRSWRPTTFSRAAETKALKVVMKA